MVTKTTDNPLATSALPSATPVKPKMAATMEMIRKANAHFSRVYVVTPSLIGFGRS
jgi:hypothetical protein